MKMLSGDRVWLTDVVPPAERFSFWREALSAILSPRVLELKSGSDFSGRLHTHQIGPLRATRGWCDPLTVLRTPREISKSRDEYLYFVCPIRGSITVEQFGRSARVTGGDCAFVTTGDPFRLEYEDMVDAVTVEIPHELAVARLQSVADAAALNLVRQSSAGASLQSFLQSLPRNPLRGNDADAHTLANVAIELLAIAARECVEWGGTGAAASYPELTGSVVQYIECHLADPLLSPARAALALGVSERSVHAAMKVVGDSFMAFVRLRRLDHIKDALSSAAQERLKVSDIAFEWGFNDLSTFHRAFRDRFGITPRQFKALRGSAAPVPH